MNIAVFDPSYSFRAVLIATMQGRLDIRWDEMVGLSDEARQSLSEVKYDAIITAKELRHSNYIDIVNFVCDSEVNNETPVFLISSDNSQSFINSAFQYGVTEVFQKQNLLEVIETLQHMIMFCKDVEGANILYVEDSNVIAQYYTTELENLKFNVLRAHSYEQAFEIISHHSVELVVTDLNLDKGMQGQYIIRDIRRDRSVSELGIPIMVLSGSAMKRHETGLFYLGIDDYLVKPVPPRQVALRCVNLIRKYRMQKATFEKASRFQEAAQYDKLTRTYSRHGFHELAVVLMNAKKASERTFGMLYFDLDHFKPVNDAHGHAVGDQVLRDAAKIIQSHITENGILSRWGGDEFLLVEPEMTRENLNKIALGINQHFQKEAEKLLGVSCSIGITSGRPQSLDQLYSMINDADMALYQSKTTERGTFSYLASNLNANGLH